MTRLVPVRAIVLSSRRLRFGGITGVIPSPRAAAGVQSATVPAVTAIRTGIPCASTAGCSFVFSPLYAADGLIAAPGASAVLVYFDGRGAEPGYSALTRPLSGGCGPARPVGGAGEPALVDSTSPRRGAGQLRCGGVSGNRRDGGAGTDGQPQRRHRRPDHARVAPAPGEPRTKCKAGAAELQPGLQC